MKSELSSVVRRLEDPLLLNSTVIGWSSPVLAFGDISISKIATVGLNPSDREFVDERGNELDGSKRRFHTLKSLKLKRWSDAESVHFNLIAKQCKEYFIGNPYDVWFKRLDYLISGADVSYYFPSSEACHLDLIPYATKKKWADLTSAQRKTLLTESKDSLGIALRDSSIKFLILNGQTVVDVFEQLADTELKKREMKEWILPRKSGKNVVGYSYAGQISSLSGVRLPRQVKVLGFNHNIQSSFGVTKKVLLAIRKWITKKIEENDD